MLKIEKIKISLNLNIKKLQFLFLKAYMII